MHKSGIYQFKNIINNKKYIGSAFDFEDRKAVHLFHLRNNTHHSKKFQNAFNKHGEENFKFEILEYVKQLENESKKDFKKRLVNDKEQYYLDNILFASNKNKSLFKKLAYNINRKADSCLGIKKKTDICIYCKRKMSITNIIRFHNDHCFENHLIDKEKEIQRRRSFRFGLTKETNKALKKIGELISIKKKKQYASGELVIWNKGKKIGISKNRASVLQFDLEGNLIEKFESILIASLLTNISSSSISNSCKKKKVVCGFMFLKENIKNAA